jgi:hypothetical protein
MPARYKTGLSICCSFILALMAHSCGPTLPIPMQELESLKDIFKGRLFRIPDYQRGYAWTKRQLEEFWEDLLNLPVTRFHYTGLLSLKKVDRAITSRWNDEQWLLNDHGYKAFHVVDGQQRLTTFIILLQAMVELLEALPGNEGLSNDEIYLGTISLKAIKEEYLVIQQPPKKIISTYKFGYETDNPSFSFLKYRIFTSNEGGSVQETFYTLNLENAKNYFKENLAHYYQKHTLEGLEVLFRKLTQNLMFNIHEISDSFDVFVAFETMNNRGKKLSNLELLKNRLIYLTTIYDEQQLRPDEQNALREKINNAWKEVYFQLGRNKQQPLNDDDFLVAHWIMYFQYTRQKGNDYIQFLLNDQFTPKNIYAKNESSTLSIQLFEERRDEELDDAEETEESRQELPFFASKLSPKDIEAYVSSLQVAAEHWYNTFNPLNNAQLTADEALWIDRLNRLGISYFRPLVTASFLAPASSASERVRLFEAIERFIFLAFRLGRSPANYRNSEFYRAARQLRNGELTIDSIIEGMRERTAWLFYNCEGDEDGQLYFNYPYFQKYIEKNFRGEGGGFYSWNGLRYFLYEYEMSKVRKRGSQKIDWKLFVKGEKDKVSIEHIYPQTATHKCWKAAFKNHKKGNLSILTGSLGNLLLLSRSINSSLQNDCFDAKKAPKFNERQEKMRQGYLDGSHSEIEVSLYVEWTPEAILERGKNLLRFMETRWDIKFEDENARLQFLNLGFMEPEV